MTPIQCLTPECWMDSRVQSTVGCFPELCFLHFPVALVLVGLRKQFINNFVYPTRACAAVFNNNNNSNSNNKNSLLVFNFVTPMDTTLILTLLISRCYQYCKELSIICNPIKNLMWVQTVTAHQIWYRRACVTFDTLNFPVGNLPTCLQKVVVCYMCMVDSGLQCSTRGLWINYLSAGATGDLPE